MNCESNKLGCGCNVTLYAAAWAVTRPGLWRSDKDDDGALITTVITVRAWERSGVLVEIIPLSLLLQLQKNGKRLIRLGIVMVSGIVKGNPPKTIAE